MGVVSGRDENEARPRRLVHDGADARQRARCRSRTCSARSARATRSRSTSSTSAASSSATRNMCRRQAGAQPRRSPTRSERRQFGKAIAEFGLIKQKLAEMAVRVLRRRRDGRTARSATSTARSRPSIAADGAAVLKTIEGFAVECSINKVVDQRGAGLGGRRGGAGVRRQRLLARVPGRARVPRRAHHAHLRGHQRDQPPDHPDAAAEAPRVAARRRR